LPGFQPSRATPRAVRAARGTELHELEARQVARVELDKASVPLMNVRDPVASGSIPSPKLVIRFAVPPGFDELVKIHFDRRGAVADVPRR
jgi:hypothetical protein